MTSCRAARTLHTQRRHPQPDFAIEAARRQMCADEPEQDDLSAARAIVRGALWSAPVWAVAIAVAWWLL